MSASRFIPVFSLVFPLAFVPALAWNLPLASYLPRSGEWHPLFYAVPPVQAPGPGMYFWGWMLTAAVVAAIVGILASFLSDKVIARIVPLVPWVSFGSVVAIVYSLRQWWVFH
jgi:hypothetical protein